MSDAIKFLLNGTPREVTGLSPTTTILQYLRETARLVGTKEGCAEGDCGACTVIVGTPDANGSVSYRAINACIVFLPTLDGRHLITVEHLKMNAVQREMVACHASQCGFCTPGFVMSLTALMHDEAKVADEKIQDAIAGNLCRCTGYRPILDAARAAAKAPGQLVTDLTTLSTICRDKMFSYEAQGQKFFSPRTTSEFAETLARHPDATVLAGGTDVGLWVTKQHRKLDVIIYTGNIDEMKHIEKSAGGLIIGGAASYAQAFESLAAYDESLEELLRRLGSKQIRNLGTVGGNIANGSPIGDGMPPLIALNARIVLRSATDTRELPLEDFFIEYRKQDKKPGEFIEKIIVPDRAPNTLFKTYKVSKRFDQDISAVCAGFMLKMQGREIKDARIVYGGMAGTPKRAAKTESFLKGRLWNEEAAVAAGQMVAQDFTPLSDMRASSRYRAQVASNLLTRFWLETASPETETRVYGYGTG